jgi:tetratricopeptide (TPR) repeat protein
VGLHKAFSFGVWVALALAAATAAAEEEEAASTATETPEGPGADSRAQARKHYESGVEDYEAGRFKDAIDHFLEANRLMPSPALSFNIARAYEKLGDTAGALAFYRDYLRRDPEAEDREEVSKIVGDLEQALRQKGLQQVTVLSTPPHATVVLDGKPVGVTPWTGEIFPGAHQLVLELKGYEEKSKTFNLTAHRSMDVSVELEPAPVQEPSPQPQPRPRTEPVSPAADAAADEGASGGVSAWTWLSFGVGAAALGGALGFELMRSSAESDAHDARTQVDAQDRYDTMQIHQTTARILLGVGAAATVVGGVLLYFDLSAGNPGERSAWLSVDCASARCGLSATGKF